MPAPVPALAAGDQYHAQVRHILEAAVKMPSRTSRVDDALDRWLLHPVFGLVVLTVVMLLIFQAVYAMGCAAGEFD